MEEMIGRKIETSRSRGNGVVYGKEELIGRKN
jgi:hypothetical protein